MQFPAFTFVTATEIRFGHGEAARAVSDLSELGRRVLLVHGSSAARSQWFRVALEAEGCTVIGFSVSGEPDVAMIEAGISAGRGCEAQVVVALGGGAVIDAGKAIAALIPATRPMNDHLEVVGKGIPLDNAPLPFAAIPTTSGAGAEVTRNAVIAVPEASRKVSLRDRRMLPHIAIIDPALTETCPPDVTLASGLDAITQVIEPYLCTRANPMTDALCRDAIPKGLVALRSLLEAPDPKARHMMAWVSLCGGLALANAGLGVVHGLAGPLGGLSGASHGAICGALLPHGLTANANAAANPGLTSRLDEIRHWITEAFGGTQVESFARLAKWSRDHGLPGLDAQGVTGVHRMKAAEMAASSSSMKSNPVSLDVSQLLKIMETAR